MCIFAQHTRDINNSLINQFTFKQQNLLKAMAKKTKTVAAPVSKYAAKYSAHKGISNENVLENYKAKLLDEEAADEHSNTETETKRVPGKYIKGDNAKVNKDSFSFAMSTFPKHIVQISLLIKNNAEIRRFTALGILNYLLQKGEISGEKRYVVFRWNKFAVRANGLVREYSYSEPFFLNALVAAFTSFSASAQRVIDEFCRKEMSTGICKAVDQDEVSEIVALNEQYQDANSEELSDNTDAE